jgi:4'-phosphopantetheinyl transferase
MKQAPFPLMTILPAAVHIWRVLLPDFFGKKNDLRALLNVDEGNRADRFKFAIHQDRFIIARALLRKILNLYTGIPPESIKFDYGNRGKPYLSENRHHLQFNLSHSEDWAVYAIAKDAEIGIDVEKNRDHFKESVAKRFFSQQEYQELIQLPYAKQAQAFYQIWVKKEAVIKVLGDGLSMPLSDFSVRYDFQNEHILIEDPHHFCELQLHSFNIDITYPAAVAVKSGFNSVENWEWKDAGPLMINKF